MSIKCIERILSLFSYSRWSIQLNLKLVREIESHNPKEYENPEGIGKIGVYDCNNLI